jgi:hypothetical protein
VRRGEAETSRTLTAGVRRLDGGAEPEVDRARPAQGDEAVEEAVVDGHGVAVDAVVLVGVHDLEPVSDEAVHGRRAGEQGERQPVDEAVERGRAR